MKYVHWLQIGGMRVSPENERKQWSNLKKYLEIYPNSKAVVYHKDFGDMFCRVVRLECLQNYRDLDLDCNSLSKGSIKHLNYKPQDINETRVTIDYYLNERFAV
jgi:hypothetical protein